jgi:hypothetical protein
MGPEGQEWVLSGVSVLDDFDTTDRALRSEASRDEDHLVPTAGKARRELERKTIATEIDRTEEIPDVQDAHEVARLA